MTNKSHPAAQLPEHFIISQELAQALASYLATQPYGQVFRLIAGLQAMQKIESVQSPDDPSALVDLPAPSSTASPSANGGVQA